MRTLSHVMIARTLFTALNLLGVDHAKLLHENAVLPIDAGRMPFER